METIHSLISFLIGAIIAHEQAEGAGLLYLFYVSVACMPKPGEPWNKQTMYNWMYQTLHTALPINKFLQSQPTINTASVVVPPEPQIITVPQVKPLSATLAQFSKK